MCRKYITIFDTFDDAQEIYDQVLENWDRRNGRPILDITYDSFDLHKTQKCRMGGRVCELCDHFNIERIEYPNCVDDCECKLTPVLQQAIIGRDYLKKLHEVANLQLEHVRYNIIKAVRQMYPDRHVMIVECGVKRDDDRDLVYAEVLVFKYPTWLKPIEGDHQCQCKSKELAESLKMVYSLRHCDGTDVARLLADLRRYEAVMTVNGPEDDSDNNENNFDEDSEFGQGDSEEDQDASSEEDSIDMEAIQGDPESFSIFLLNAVEFIRMEQLRLVQLRNLARRRRLAEID